MIDKNSQEYQVAKACVIWLGYKVSVFDVETSKHTIYLKRCSGYDFDSVVDDCNLREGRLGEVNFGLGEVSFYIGRD